jgi:hypothetical protein
MAAGAARPRGEARARVGELTGAGHGVRERELGQAGLRLRAESEAPIHLAGEKAFLYIFQFFFLNFQNAAALNQFLSNKMIFSGNGPKIKIA